MKHYRITVKMFADDGHIIERQAIEFVAFDCRHHGKTIRKAAPNKKMIFCTFNALVENCTETAYDGDCARWELQGIEMDTVSGGQRYITFKGDADKISVERDGYTTGCGSKYDEYFDNWLF